MKTFLFTVENKDEWAMCDANFIIIARDEEHAKELLPNNEYHFKFTDGKMIELTEGVHTIQGMIVM